MTRRLSVLGLVPYPLGTSPSQRYRLEQWRPVLESERIDLTLLPFAAEDLMRVLHQPGRRSAKVFLGMLALFRRCRELLRARRHDVVVVHRAAALFGPALLERLHVLMGGRVVFDFDDAIYLLHTSAANRGVGWLKFPGKTATLCRLSRHVVVANDELASYARRHNPRVSVVPSSVDTDAYRPRARARQDGVLRVGWTGSSTSLTYLELFAPTLRELLARQPIELHVHSDRVPELPEIPFAWHRWTPETEVDELARFDVGIMPMPEDEWARGKSAMKALLYMAMGIPAVCSPVGTNLVLVRPGENALLARTVEDWCAAIGRLSADGDLRARIGRAGRATVEERYSKRVCGLQFASVLREVAG